LRLIRDWIRGRWGTLLILSAGLFYIAYGHWVERASSLETPTTRTCAQIERDGPGGNSFVRMTDYVLCDWNPVHSGRWGQRLAAWVPVIPSGTPEAAAIRRAAGASTTTKPADPAHVRVLVEFTGDPKAADLAAVADASHLDGMIVPMSSMKESVLDDLEAAFPRSDFELQWILEPHARSSVTKIVVFGALGSITGWYGVRFFLLWLREHRDRWMRRKRKTGAKTEA
jgi:hypothetical protein